MNLEKYFESPEFLKKFKKCSYIVLGLLVVIDFVIPRHQPHFFWDKIPGFSALYGFIACSMIVVVSKWVGKKWLMKPDDYYD